MSLPTIRLSAVNTGAMAQPYKGERPAYVVVIDLDVRREIHTLATNSKLTVNQFVADHLALHVGRPDLVEALGKGQSGRFKARLFDPEVKTLTIRCPMELRAAIAEKAARCGTRYPATYVIDFVNKLAKNGGATVGASEMEYAYQEELLTSA